MKTLIIGLMALLAISMFSFAMAEENSTNIEEPNITQTVDQTTVNEINDDLNESVNVFKVGWLKLDILLTFNQEKKAEKELKLARLELIRSKIAAKNNDTEAMEKAIDAHNRILERIQKRMDSIDGESTKQGIKNSATKLISLERAIQVHEARIAKFNEILASENLTDEQRLKIQAKIGQAENNTAHLNEVKDAQEEKLRTRLMAVSNMTEEQANAEIQELEDAQNLSAVKKMVAEVKANRAENAANVLSKVIEKIESKQNETGKNMSNAIEKLTEVQQKLQNKAETINSRTD
jgi:uncharacterized protein YxeA